MEATWLPFLAYCVVLSSVRCQTKILPMCSKEPTSAVQVAVRSLRNQAGHWVTKVDMDRGGGRGRMEELRTEPWSVDVSCNTRTCEAAESVLHVSIILTAPLPKSLGADYEIFPGVGYYNYYRNATTWFLARKTCAEEGAHLAIINSEQEAGVIRTLNARYPNVTGATHRGWAWIGHERRSGDEFFTIFGDSLNSTGYTRWHRGQPDIGDYCGDVNLATGELGDGTCTAKQPFFCEHEL